MVDRPILPLPPTTSEWTPRLVFPGCIRGELILNHHLTALNKSAAFWYKVERNMAGAVRMMCR